MKKIEIIIKPERLDDLMRSLEEFGIHGLMVSNVMGYGKQKGYTSLYRGIVYNVNLLPKIKVQTVMPEGRIERLLTRIQKEINTGMYGDGKIFVYDVVDAVRIRTGERGEEAL